MGRVVRQVVTVGLLTLVFGAVAASPAAANQRGDAVTAANDFISGCVANGGDPDGTFSRDNYISVTCLHDNGSFQTCDWLESHEWERECWWTHPEVRSPDAATGVEIGDTIYQAHAAGRQGVAAQADGAALTSIVTDSGDPNDGDQGANARGKGNDADKHHKNKTKGYAKKHGKSEGHEKGGRRK
jgi:hypothetical protein